MRSERGASLIVVVLGLLIVALAIWWLIGRAAEDTVGAFSEVGMPLDETKRQRTIADMQAIGRANAAMRADTGSYALTFAALETGGYLAQVPTVDGWGTPWMYAASEAGFALTSLGSDGAAGPEPPSPWTGGAYPCDLVMKDGQLVQAPASR